MDKLGDRLLKQRLINSEQLSEAIARQQACADVLRQVVIDLGFVTEEQIAATFAIEYKIPYLSLDRYEISQKIMRMVDESAAREYCLIPIEICGDVLSVAMADPTQGDVLEMVARISNCKVQPFVSVPSEIRGAIVRHYKKSLLTSNDRFQPESIDENPVISEQSIEHYDSNRRKTSRIDCQLPLMLVTEQLDAYVLSVETENLSEQGLLCRVREPFLIGTSVAVWIEIPGTQHARAQGKGRVIRINRIDSGDPNSDYEVAITFRPQCDRSKQSIERYLRYAQSIRNN